MASPVEWKNEFQVNTGTANTPSIFDPQTIGLSNGNYLVAWVEQGTTGVGTTPANDIVGKIFDAEGNVVRDSFRINTNLNADDEDDFDIAATNDGGFIIVYVDDDISNSSQEAIIWEKHNAAGNMTNTVTVASNVVAADVLSNPKVVVNNNDNTSYVTFTDDVGVDTDVRAVRLSATGATLTAEFNAAQNSSDFDGSNDAAININGELVSIYREDDGGTFGVELRVYNTAGTLQHALQIANGPASDPHVTTLTNGNIVAVWTEGTDVKYRVFNQNLVPDPVGGGPFNVDGSADTYNEPMVIGMPDGGFAIVWDNETDNTIQARHFNANGSVSGTDTVFTVDPGTGQTSPSIGVTADGRILFTWEEGDNVYSSIWDTRGGTINANNYDGLPLNFVETGVTTTGTSGTNLIGDSDADTILGQSGSDTIDGNAGDDSILGGGGSDSIDGDSGNDTLEGGFSVDTVNGGGGNDLIIVNDGEFIDVVDGGTGSDTLDLSDIVGAGEAVNVDLRNDTWTGFGGTHAITNIETVIGTQEDDVLRGKGGTTLNGGDGDDTLDFRSGDGLPDFDGGNGVDTADFSTFTGTNFFIDLDAGGYRFSSIVPGAFSGDLLNIENYEGSGGSGRDNIIGSSAANLINTGDGNDTINGGGGADTVNSGGGNDFVDIGGSTSGMVVDAGSGNDTVVANNSAAETLDGGTGVDLLDTTKFNGTYTINLATGTTNFGEVFTNFENIIMGNGNNNLTGTNGANFITTGSGNDTISSANANDTIDSGAGNDSIDAGAGNDSVDAGSGNDSVFGGGGNDSIEGGDGDDNIVGWTGNDTMDGGAGIDTADYSAFGSGLTVNLLNTGAQFVSVQAGTDTLTNFENLIGGLGGDNMTGTNGDNIIDGNIGNDFLYGQRGNDLIFGGAGFDQLRGNKDMDTLDGGAGRDVLVGGSEADTFQFSQLSHTAVGGFRDRIVDFAQGEDIIDISAFDAIAGGGDDAFTFIDMDAFGTAGAGALRYFFQGSKTIIEGDVDGDNVRDFQIEMIGNIALTAGDFVL